jgi:hypothetical protein
VFVDEVGVPPHPETITRWWREAVSRAGLSAIRLHDARHTAATVMLRAGIPVKVVSQRLGHSDVAVTMRVYQHVTAQDDRAAADALSCKIRDQPAPILALSWGNVVELGESNRPAPPSVVPAQRLSVLVRVRFRVSCSDRQ